MPRVITTQDVVRAAELAGGVLQVEAGSVVPTVARQRAEQLRIALEAMPIAFGDQVIYITASFGVSNFPEHGATQDELIQASDNAMYLAKTGGRNRVVIAPAPALPAPPQ